MPNEPSDFERLTGPDRRRVPRPHGLAGLVALIAVGVVVGLVALYPPSTPDIDLSDFGFADDVVPATVTAVEIAECPDFPGVDCSIVEFSDAEGVVVHTQSFPDDGSAQPQLEVGDEVFLSVVDAGDGTNLYNYADRDRTLLLGAVALLFAAAVVGLGRMRGLAALLGLGISLLVLLGFIVPAIIAGEDAVLVAAVGGSAIILVALYLAHGYTPLTHVAAVGAFAALALTTALSWGVLELAQFTGLAGEESYYLLLIPGFDISGLLLAGIVLGAIGALDDVTVTQASAVWEVRQANPALESGDLFASGLRVGRDHIASTVNTLLLAYAGAAMPLLILLSLSRQPFASIASSEVVAVEIVRTLVGSIGLVASVPITTWLASRQAIGSLA
ncbi:MAG TPA: YibE/F family protein [Acidimicrobiia bacterium]